MSLDPSLKTKGALARHRNVLTRAERIEKLKDEERWEDGDGVLGLPKVANRKVHTSKKDAKEETTEEATEATVSTETTETPAGQ
jgi:small basic protein (TIGR04137 family)